MKKRSGFTVAEMVIVLGIASVIIAIALAYSSTTNRSIGLYTEQAKLAGVLSRAKSLALQRYSQGGDNPLCGTGVRFDSRTSYSLFLLGANPDGSCNFESLSNMQVIDTFLLEEGVEFENMYGEVAFEPPYLKVYGAGTYVLEVSGSVPRMTADVTVNVGGGISTR